MASPRRGVLAPPALRFPPGIGGRRRGAGEDIALDLSISGDWLRFESIDMLKDIRKCGNEGYENNAGRSSLPLGLCFWLPCLLGEAES